VKDSLIQHGIYVDTFTGHDYRLDVEENLGAVSPVCKAKRTLENFPVKTVFYTEEQKRLQAFFKEIGR